MASAYATVEQKTKTIQLRIPVSLIQQLDDWGKKVGQESRSSAIRSLIKDGLLREAS